MTTFWFLKMLFWRAQKLVLKISKFDCSKIGFSRTHFECSNLAFSLSTDLRKMLYLEHLEGAPQILVVNGKPTTSSLCTDLGVFQNFNFLQFINSFFLPDFGAIISGPQKTSLCTTSTTLKFHFFSIVFQNAKFDPFMSKNRQNLATKRSIFLNIL